MNLKQRFYLRLKINKDNSADIVPEDYKFNGKEWKQQCELMLTPHNSVCLEKLETIIEPFVLGKNYLNNPYKLTWGQLLHV